MKKDNGTHRIRKGILAVFMNLILIIFSLSCIFPMIWMLYSSLKEKRAFNADIVGLPKNPTIIWENPCSTVYVQLRCLSF